MAAAPEPPASRRTGVLYAVASAVLFGISTPVSRLLLRGAHPVALASLLYLGAGLGLALWALAPGAPWGRAPTRAERPRLVAPIALGGVAGPLLLLLGLRVVPATTAALLLNLEGVFTALLAWIIFREAADRRLVLGFGLVVAGSVLLSFQGAPTSGGAWGAAAIAGACLCWAADNNLTRGVSDLDPRWIVLLKGLAAGAFNALLALALGVRWPTPPALGGALLLGFVSNGLSLILFVLALRHLGAARTGAWFALAPFVGAALAVPMLGERPPAMAYPAAALMAVGLWLHLSERHQHEHAHEAIEHEHAHDHDEHHQHLHPEGVEARDGHAHRHQHAPLRHRHAHFPDTHHRHDHGA